jgi:hypothetical protein
MRVRSPPTVEDRNFIQRVGAAVATVPAVPRVVCRMNPT